MFSAPACSLVDGVPVVCGLWSSTGDYFQLVLKIFLQ